MYNIGCLHTVFGRVWRGVIDTKCFLAENTGFDEMGNLHKSSLGLIFRALLGVSVKSCSEAAGQIMLRSCWFLRPRPPTPHPRLPGHSDLLHVLRLLALLDDHHLDCHVALSQGIKCETEPNSAFCDAGVKPVVGELGTVLTWASSTMVDGSI